MQARKRFFRTLQTIVAILPDRYADSAWAACQTPYLCTSISYKCGTKVSEFRAKNLPFGKPRFGKQSNTSIKQKLLLSDPLFFQDQFLLPKYSRKIITHYFLGKVICKKLFLMILQVVLNTSERFVKGL